MTTASVHRLKPRIKVGRLGCPHCKQPLDSEFCPRDGFPGIPFERLDLTDVLQGSTVDQRYSLLYRIGRGGMADVYAAWDSAPRAEVALKVIRPELTTDDSIITRFKREAAAISRLEHPHIIKLAGAGRTSDGLVYLVLERLVGRTLEEYIQQEAPVDPARAALLLAPLCDALHALHKLGIMHRDLKPANIFLALGEDGREVVKLLDFGIARRLKADPIDDRLSGGKVLGSVCYAAPEIARKGVLDQRTDLYSIGVLLHELLTGQLPFDASTPLEILRKQVEEDVPALPEWIPAGYRALTMELLAKTPDFRPPDAAEVAHRLRELAAGVGTAAMAPLPTDLLGELADRETLPDEWPNSLHPGSAHYDDQAVDPALGLGPGGIITPLTQRGPHRPVAAKAPSQSSRIAYLAFGAGGALVAGLLAWLFLTN